jgi:hypothetical protein
MDLTLCVYFSYSMRYLLGLFVVLTLVSDSNSMKYVGMISGGCVGSSVVQMFLRRFLALHGFVVCESRFEPFHTMLNGVHDVSNLTAFIEHEKKCVENNADIYVFKQPSSKNEDVQKYLSKQDTRTFALIRQNVLDHRVCSIRDCFDRLNTGYPCNSAGDKVNYCMSRRENSSLDVLVCFNQKKVIPILLSDLHRIQSNRSYSAISEELLAFQYHIPNALKSSVVAWTSLLNHIGVITSIEKMTSIIFDLNEPQRRYHPHNEVIRDYDLIENLILASGNLELITLLRPRPKADTKPNMTRKERSVST